MADQKHKTPEELGEAVGKKIEELFGGLFGEDQQEVSEPPKETTPAPTGVGRTVPLTAAAAPPPVPKPEPPKKSEPVRRLQPVPQTRPAAPQPKPQAPQARPQPPKPKPQPVPAPKPAPTGVVAPNSFDDIMDRIEALFLTLEWEVTPETVKDLGAYLGSLDRFLPQNGPAKTIVNMNLRVLPKLNSPDATPHPSWLRLLQDSVTALKHVHSSGGKQPPQPLITAITGSYKEITAAMGISSAMPAPRKQAPAPPSVVTQKPAPAPRTVAPARLAPAQEAPRTPSSSSLVARVDASVKSVEEVSQRLSRILGVLRQGGAMSKDDITRRLGTLENLLSERVGQLASLGREVSLMEAGFAPAPAGAGTEADGLLLTVWYGALLAVPSNCVEAIYPITRAQAEQFIDKPVISIANKHIQRLPLRKPQSAPNTMPTWLVHMSSGGKDYFLLTDRLLGYRRVPRGADLNSQARVKIGPTSYILINQAILK